MKNMKFIKSREKFLNEAKIKDVIFGKQATKVKSMWGEKYLNYEEVTPTDNIKQGKWKLDEKDKMKVLGQFFDADMENVFDTFKTLPPKFGEILSMSLDFNLIREDKEKYESVFKDFNINEPSIGQIVCIFDSVFRKLDTRETMATEMISRDATGRPIKDADNNMVKITKQSGDPIFSKNLVNINSFVEDYNTCYPDSKIDNGTFSDDDIRSVRNLALEDHNGEYKTEFDIFGKDLYLSISHNPKDILNMSISKFYSSCQHLYSGGYNDRVLGNVFDPNSIPAFLVFDTPIFWDDEKISDQLPLSRMVIRNMEQFDDSKKPLIFFDRAYPDRMKDVFDDMVIKYSGNFNNAEQSMSYFFTPDIELGDDNIREPYMDRLDLKRGKFIGVNTKTLYLNRISDWGSYKISKNAKIKELIIETTDLPENLFEITLNLDWIKFKYLKIKDITNFDKLKTNSIAFDKCSFDGSLLNELKAINPGLSKLSIIACDIENLDLSGFKELDELQLVYSLEDVDQLKNLIEGINIKHLVVSGDLVSNKETKSYLNSLKSRGVKIEIVGPVI